VTRRNGCFNATADNAKKNAAETAEKEKTSMKKLSHNVRSMTAIKDQITVIT